MLFLGLLGIAELYFLALVEDSSAILLVYTCQNLHQCGLAGAVFTQQDVHLALLQLEGHAVQRLYARKNLCDFFQL